MELERVTGNPSSHSLISSSVKTTSLGEDTVSRLGGGRDVLVGHFGTVFEALGRDDGGSNSDEGKGELHIVVIWLFGSCII